MLLKDLIHHHGASKGQQVALNTKRNMMRPLVPTQWNSFSVILNELCGIVSKFEFGLSESTADINKGYMLFQPVTHG